MGQLDAASACTEFLEWVRSILPEDKYYLFVSLFRYPVPTNEITEQVYNELTKIFNSRNPFYHYEFTDPDLEDDWADYKDQNVLGHEFWQTKAWEVMKTAINSVMIVDLPEEQSGSRPEPFVYFKNIGAIHDFRTTDGSQMEWLTYRFKRMIEGKEVEYYAVIDDETYRVFEISEKGDIDDESPLLESPHELGFCPARFFWTTALKAGSPEIKKSPISNQLSNLDKLLKRYLDKDYSDLSAAYPIYWSVEQDCDFEDRELGHACDGGFVRNAANEYVLDGRHNVLRCPVCSTKRMTGPGAMVEIPVPDKESDLREPVGIINADVETLKYQTEEIRRKESDIYYNIVGRSEGVQTDKALNEMQVAAATDNKETVLINLKRNFEYAQTWAEDAMCRLRYQTQFVSLSIDYGTEFIHMTVAQLNQKYAEAKKAGSSDVILDAIADQIIEVEFRNNPVAKQRALMLQHLEPYRHHSIEELLKLPEGTVNSTDLKLKLKFSNLVAQFEREQTSILDWGADLEFAERVKRITKILKSYDD